MHQRFAAEAAKALRQTRIGNRDRAAFIDTCVLLQKRYEALFAFFGLQLPDNFILQWRINFCPLRAEQILFAQHRRCCIAFEFLPFYIFQIELRCAWQIQRLAHLDKTDFQLHLKHGNDLIALRQRETVFAQIRMQHSQVVHFLVDTKSLRTRQRQWSALFCWQ